VDCWKIIQHHLANNYLALDYLYTAINLPPTILVLRSFFFFGITKKIPKIWLRLMVITLGKCYCKSYCLRLFMPVTTGIHVYFAWNELYLRPHDP